MNAWVVCSTIIERTDGKILLLQQAPGEFHAGKWGFPGGILDPGRTLLEQAIHEIKEETNLDVKIEGLIGIYKEEGGPVGKPKEQTIIFTFKGKLIGGEVKIPKEEISGFKWVSVEELENWDVNKLRPMISQTLNDYAQGKTFPLELISIAK